MRWLGAGFMVAQRKVLASYDCLNAANTRGDVHRLGVSLPDRGHFCFCTAYAQRNRLAQRALTEHRYSGRFVDFIRTVHDSTARIWFWYRGITHPSSLAGASAQSAHASGVWGRAVYRGPDDQRLGITPFRQLRFTRVQRCGFHDNTKNGREYGDKCNCK